jgi:hypothetical protein
VLYLHALASEAILPFDFFVGADSGIGFESKGLIINFSRKRKTHLPKMLNTFFNRFAGRNKDLYIKVDVLPLILDFRTSFEHFF